MSGGSSPADRDEHILSVGHQCSSPTCLLVDFLPFKCQHCSKSFCGDHFLPAGHNCDKFDETKFNRVVPDCPLCNEPVAIPPGEDPNVRMERHLNVDCSVMTGKSRKPKSARCAKGKCGKTLISPIKCDKCNQQFCPQHRFPNTHDCSSLASPAKPAIPKSASVPQPGKALLAATSQVSKAGASAMASVKQSVAAAKPSALTSARSDPSPTKPKSSTSMPNLFSKTDRRAREERESQRRAMQARARRGLLSEEEKVILATLEAEHSKGRLNGDKECIVM
ncbi:hypothetical protein OF83DRAFT_798272 [Amylostereum chailletii]|nr:hypothetical protein OF83DRAFT_798272 [Amylostereum chailletii]